MAIVQISRITQRKGLLTDLPQPLAGAEFGWAVDERRLFIGNGTLVDGAPVVGNTEVLTEFSDVLSFATAYTYKGEAGGYTVQTGATAGTAVSQSIQSRLDSYAIITDFGATGDGVTDVTNDINRALYEIFCRDVNTQVRRSLFFPAGTYIITDTLLIPPYCRLYGEGSDSTIIYFQVEPYSANAGTPTLNNVAYPVDALVSYSGSYYRSQAAVPIGQSIGDPTYWAAETLPDYIARTADSQQQTGVSIADNGALLPGNVEISGIKFVTNMLNDGILIEKAKHCFFDAVSVEGPGTTGSLTTITDNNICVSFESDGASAPNQHISFTNCDFGGMVWGVNTDNDYSSGVTFDKCNFDTMYQAVYLGNSVAPAVGPVGFRISNSNFDNVYAEGISFVNCSRNISAYNNFNDVGNNFNGSLNPATAVIDLDADNNVSVGDMFARTNQYSGTYPRIAINDTNSMSMSMNVHDIEFNSLGAATYTPANSLDLGTYQRIAGVVDTLTDAGGANLCIVESGEISSFKFDYTIRRNTARRTGTITVVCGTGGGSGFSYSDDYVENSSTGITLSASDTGTQVVVGYTASSTGANGTIKYSITTLG